MAEIKRNLLLKKDFEKTRKRMRLYYLYGYSTLLKDEANSDATIKNEIQRIRYWMNQPSRKGRKRKDFLPFDDTMAIDIHSIRHNPFYKAWKSKIFDSNAICFHFLLFSVLKEHPVGLPSSIITEKIDELRSNSYGEDKERYQATKCFDTRTVQSYLKEYKDRGMIASTLRYHANPNEKAIKKPHYYIPNQPLINQNHYDAISFFSEVAPCGVIGSYVLDKLNSQADILLFKHHFITNTLDSEMLFSLLNAIQTKQMISVINNNRKQKVEERIQLIPLKIYISARNGRQYLVAQQVRYGSIRAFRLDYLSKIKTEGVFPNYDHVLELFNEKKEKMWGVNIIETREGEERLETVEMILKIGDNEPYIIHRINNEKRCGTLTQIDSQNNLYKFEAQVFDSKEMIPWIRTFICRIVKIKFSNTTLQAQFENDLKKMYSTYGIDRKENL